MGLATTVGIETGTPANLAPPAPPAPNRGGARPEAAAGTGAADDGPQLPGQWKNLLAVLGLTVGDAAASSRAGSEAGPLPPQSAEGKRAPAGEDAGRPEGLRAGQKLPPNVAERAAAHARARHAAGAAAKSPPSPKSAFDEHPGKAKAPVDAAANAGLSGGHSGLELVAAACPADFRAPAVLHQMHSEPWGLSAPVAKAPDRVAGARPGIANDSASPRTGTVPDGSIADARPDGKPGDLAQLADSGTHTTRDPATPLDEPSNANGVDRGGLAVAEQTAEHTLPLSPPLAVAGRAENAVARPEQSMPGPISSSSPDGVPRHSVAGSSPLSGRVSKSANSAKEWGAREAAVKIEGETPREGTRLPAREPIAFTFPPGQHSDAIAVMASKHEIAPGRGGMAPGDPFDVLDTPGIPQPAWIRAGAHHAEAGYLDPALGWIEVRADGAASGLHAALIPPSSEAAQVLGNHLAGLNAYVAQHHGASSSVTMADPGAGQGAQPGQGGAAHKNPAEQSQASKNRSGSISAAPHGAAASREDALHALGGDARYISVVA